MKKQEGGIFGSSKYIYELSETSEKPNKGRLYYAKTFRDTDGRDEYNIDHNSVFYTQHGMKHYDYTANHNYEEIVGIADGNGTFTGFVFDEFVQKPSSVVDESGKYLVIRFLPGKIIYSERHGGFIYYRAGLEPPASLSQTPSSFSQTPSSFSQTPAYFSQPENPLSQRQAPTQRLTSTTSYEEDIEEGDVGYSRLGQLFGTLKDYVTGDGRR